MKTWTVVIEVRAQDHLNQHEIKAVIEDALFAWTGSDIAQYQIFETIEASYGPKGVTVQCSTSK